MGRNNFDALLRGEIHPDDAPPELRELARLIQLARGPAEAAELINESVVVSDVAAAVRRASVLGGRSGVSWKRRALRLVSAKAIAVSAALLIGGGVAAAATGSLPAPVQRAVADGLRHIGVSLPEPSTETTSHVHQSTAVPHGQTSLAKFGLCVAYLHQVTLHASAGVLSSARFAELSTSASADGETVVHYCEVIAGDRSRSMATGSSGQAETKIGHRGSASHGAAKTTRTTGSAQSNGNGHGKPSGSTTPSGSAPGKSRRHQASTRTTRPARHASGRTQRHDQPAKPTAQPGRGPGNSNRHQPPSKSTTPPRRGSGAGSGKGAAHGKSAATPAGKGGSAAHR
ncbi:MAG: hypothetical protein ACYCSF_07915 [Acidimicrobiales bacterium]